MALSISAVLSRLISLFFFASLQVSNAFRLAVDECVEDGGIGWMERTKSGRRNPKANNDRNKHGAIVSTGRAEMASS